MATLPEINGNPTTQSPADGDVPLRYVMMRGRNTGAGPTYIYWQAREPDFTGYYYPSPDPDGVPFVDLTDIMISAVLRT